MDEYGSLPRARQDGLLEVGLVVLGRRVVVPDLDLAGLRRDEPPGMNDYPLSLPWKSDDLSAALGVTVSDEDRHTALGDAKWAMRIYDAVTGNA